MVEPAGGRARGGLSEACGAATLRRHVTGGRCLPPPHTPPSRLPEMERFAKGGSDKLFSLIRLKEFPLGANGVYLSQLSRPGQEPVNPPRGGWGVGARARHRDRGRAPRATTSHHKEGRGNDSRPSPIIPFRLLMCRNLGAAEGEAPAGRLVLPWPRSACLKSR